MADVYVQFLDDSETEVIAYFGSEQDADTYPNQKKLDDSDPRYLAYLELFKPNTAALAAAERDRLMAAASQAMTPLLVSLQLGDATDEEIASAKAWQAYTRALKALDLTAPEPAWPNAPA